MRRFFSRVWSTPVIAVAFLFAAPHATVLAGIAYAITGAGGTSSSLFTMDSTNGNVVSTIGTVTVGGTGVMVSGIAFDPVNGLLYGATVGPVSGKGELLTINAASAVATPVGSFGLTPPNTNATSLAFASSGTLFGYVKTGSQPESLFTINTTTGSAALVGSSGIASTSGDGMAVSPTGTLYLAGKGATGPLYTLNTSTGLATAGPTLSGAPLSLSQIKGLAFDGSGTLVGLDLQPTSFLADLVKVDPNTGIITNLGSTTNGTIALAFPLAAVPEPGSIALVGFAGALWLARLARTRGKSHCKRESRCGALAAR